MSELLLVKTTEHCYNLEGIESLKGAGLLFPESNAQTSLLLINLEPTLNFFFIYMS